MANAQVRRGGDVPRVYRSPKMAVADAVTKKQRAPVAWEGTVHVLWGFDRAAAKWAFFCGQHYAGDAHNQLVSEEPITCLLCKGGSSRDTGKLETPW